MNSCYAMLRYALYSIVCSLVLTIGVRAQEIIVNELFNSSGNDEWVELLVVQDSLDLRGWDIHDFSSSGASQVPLVFSSNSLWSSVPKGTIIVIARPEATTIAEDTDPSDFLLVIKSNNGLYFSGTVFLFSGASDAIQIRKPGAQHVFGVSWGSANSSSIPSPKAHFTSGMSSNNTIFFNGDSLSQLTNTANWTFNTATQTRGAGNTVANVAWINRLRSNTTGDGSGTAKVLPDTIVHGTIYDLAVTYHRDTAYTITDLRVILPFNFSWSHSTGSVSATNMTSTTSVSGDTIYFNALSLSADSSVITIQSVTGPESTAYYPIRVQTRALNVYANVTPTPVIVGFGLPAPISTVKGNDGNGVVLRLGQLVTIRAIVTVANQFGGPSYIQDNSGGLAIFGSLFSTAVSTGDEVVVSGKVDPFNGLTEITSPYLHSIVSSGNTVTPVPVTCAQVATDGAGGLENYEGMLVRINGVVVRDLSNNPIANWTVAGAGSNYRLIDPTDSLDMRVDNNVDFANTPAPQSQFDIIGVVGQFQSTSPYIGGYQLLPRAKTDIIANGPIIATAPYEDSLTPVSMRINWTTVNPGTSRLRYGTSEAYELGVIEPDGVLRTSHAIDLTGLSPATMYHVQVFSVSGSDTSSAADLVVSTSSPASSTGQMNVYFNKSVDNSLAISENALGNQDLIGRVVARINAARYSIDLCLYSLSANAQGDVIAGALISAWNRGVKVRVICEYDNRFNGGSSFPALAASGIPVIDDRFDAIWAGAGLMHDKFFVFDYRGGAPESIWVWTGSWNPTFQGTTQDRQNSIEIQDKALAGAYTTEFNEMWGSSTDVPNASTTRFGGRKLDNTPHRFVIGGIPVSAYFSPSDRTTTHLRETIGKAQHSVACGILTFTRKDIADSVISRKNAGDKTRVVVDNNTDTGNQYSYLQSNGVDIHLKGGSGLLHHKYAVIDGDQGNGTQYLLTGSHNWSNSAENNNDENMIIVQSARIANLYLQEFGARYYEAGGTDSIRLSVAPLFSRNRSSIPFDTVTVGNSRIDSLNVTNTGSASLSISTVSSTDTNFAVTPGSATLLPGAGQKFYVTFMPHAAVPYVASVVFVHNAVGSPDTLPLTGTGRVPSGGTVAVSFPVQKGWTLLSVPVKMPDKHKSVLYPSSIGSAFAYVGGYDTAETLGLGQGYWLKFPADSSVTLEGLPVTLDTIPVRAKWNIIGGLTQPVATSSIGAISTTILTDYFGYNGGYSSATTLLPGRGYWVRVSGSGSLVLSSSGSAPKPKPDPLLASLNWISFADNQGHLQTLYFGAPAGKEVAVTRFELPPVPPQGAFDVRFASGRFAELVDPGEARGTDYPILIQSPNPVLTVKWSIDTQTANVYNLYCDRTVHLAGTGEARIDLTSAKNLRLQIGVKHALPEEFALFQNYPNPFNPYTRIAFALPRHATVTIGVYNILGEQVAMPLRGQEMDAGFHDIGFDASQLSSGVYYYQMQAVASDGHGAEFHDVKKFVVLK